MLRRYRTIVVDPPWDYPEGFARNKGGRYGDGTSSKQAKNVPLPYEPMSLDQIKALPVPSRVDPDGAWLWLWTTNRYLPEAFGVAHAWGFTYRQTFVWHKNDGHPRFPPVGHLSPARAEYVLVCARGRPQRLAPVRSNVIEVPFNPRKFAHSQKPDAFLDLVEATCPGPYLEMFARRARFGWDYYGDESLGTASMPTTEESAA